MQTPRLIRALRRETVDRTPIWLMRQAGRYLPEYRQIRSQVDGFMDLCQHPDLACEVTLQPLRRFDLDAAIIFSDILTIPHAMGLGLHFIEGQGPCFRNKIQQPRDIQRLAIPDPEQELTYVLDAIRLTKRELPAHIPLIGFCGSPWTIAAYMLEGNANKAFPALLNLAKEDPNNLHLLLDKLAEAVQLHLNAQIQAGADVVMIFDSWGGLLSADDYPRFSLHYIQHIITGLHRHHAGKAIPNIVFAKGCQSSLSTLAASGCDALGLDQYTNIATAQAEIGDRVALQGNLDPAIMTETPEKIVAASQHILSAYGSNPGHIFNLGHGITPDVPPEHVKLLVDTVHEFSENTQQTAPIH